MGGTLFYNDKPIFALDIGHANVKVMQLSHVEGKSPTVSGYGFTEFDEKAIVDGVIVDPVTVAKAINAMFLHSLIGDISTKRVAVTLPSAKTYHRTLTLPRLAQKDILPAIELENEQFIPVPSSELYADYEITAQTNDSMQILTVAAPKKVVDSYAQLTKLLGLEAVLFEPTISSSVRLCQAAERANKPTILIDFGTQSADISVYDKGIIVSGTVAEGGEHFTEAIATALGVNQQEAHIIKTRYGIGPSRKQSEIQAALAPSLDRIIREIKKIIRYYTDRQEGTSEITEIITMGGGANLPGLQDYLHQKLGIHASICHVWDYIRFGDLQPPHEAERSLYVTVAGLALVNPKEIFA
jgi:type IV pilus assembly protein PilM